MANKILIIFNCVNMVSPRQWTPPQKEGEEGIEVPAQYANPAANQTAVFSYKINEGEWVKGKGVVNSQGELLISDTPGFKIKDDIVIEYEVPGVHKGNIAVKCNYSNTPADRLRNTVHLTRETVEIVFHNEDAKQPIRNQHVEYIMGKEVTKTGFASATKTTAMTDGIGCLTIQNLKDTKEEIQNQSVVFQVGGHVGQVGLSGQDYKFRSISVNVGEGKSQISVLNKAIYIKQQFKIVFQSPDSELLKTLEGKKVKWTLFTAKRKPEEKIEIKSDKEEVKDSVPEIKEDTKEEIISTPPEIKDERLEEVEVGEVIESGEAVIVAIGKQSSPSAPTETSDSSATSSSADTSPATYEATISATVMDNLSGLKFKYSVEGMEETGTGMTGVDKRTKLEEPAKPMRIPHLLGTRTLRINFVSARELAGKTVAWDLAPCGSEKSKAGKSQIAEAKTQTKTTEKSSDSTGTQPGNFFIEIPGLNLSDKTKHEFVYEIEDYPAKKVTGETGVDKWKSQLIELTEYPDPLAVEIRFVSNLDLTGKKVKWVLTYHENSLEVKKEDSFTITAEKKLRLPETPFTDLSFRYSIEDFEPLKKERFISIRPDPKTDVGKPVMVVKQYLTGIPFHITFKDKKTKELLKGTPLEWGMKNGGLENSGETNRDGMLVVENIPLPTEDLVFTYKILGEEDSHTFSATTFKDIETEGFKKGIEKTFEIGSDEKDFSSENPGRHWLTYETRFNWTTFSKTNQRLKLRLFRTNVINVLAMLAPKSDLGDEELRNLQKVFFPEVRDLEKLRDFGRAPWEDPRIKFKYSPTTTLGNREVNKLYKGSAVFPYNLRDNQEDSAAIGTRNKSRIQGYKLEALEKTLEMWNTASRSSIADIRVESPGFVDVLLKKDSAQSPKFEEEATDLKLKEESVGDKFEMEPIDRSVKKVVGEESKAESKGGADLLWGDAKVYGRRDPGFLEPDAAGTSELKLPDKGGNFYEYLYSVKTGVNLIGYHKQGNLVGKDKLEHNSILAALRSAYIRQVERDFGYKSFDDPNLLVLTEVMTVTEADPKWDKWMFAEGEKARSKEAQPQFGDGYQIRSLRGMKHDKEYFPPISIPFVKIKDKRVDKESTCKMSYKRVITSELLSKFFDEGLPRSKSVFEQIDDPEWDRFWRRHYAVPLGRAKARLLLRYGLQGFGGNAQNFLLEMEDGLPNGRIVVRDMGDYALHDFVLWALFGPGKGEAPDSRTEEAGKQNEIVEQWKKAFVKTPLLEYECDVLHQYVDNSAGMSEFPTFTGYHRAPKSGMSTFNPFCDKCDNAGAAKFVGHISPLWAYAMPVSTQVFKSYNTNVPKATWAKVFKAEIDWGIRHAEAWLEYIEKALDHKFTDVRFKPVPVAEFLGHPDWAKTKENAARANRIYEPQAFIEAIEKESFGAHPWRTIDQYTDRWEDLYQKFKVWEMYVGWQVENYLRTEAGQKAIRRYRDKPVEPSNKFVLRCVNKHNLAISPTLRIVNLENKKSWEEKAGPGGEINLTGLPEDYRFEILYYGPEIGNGTYGVEDIKRLIDGTLDFSAGHNIKIIYEEA